MDDIENLRELVAKEKNATNEIFENRAVQESEKNNNNETDTLIEKVFQSAVVTKVEKDDQLKGKMLDTAKKYTETKMKIIENRVDKEDKQAFFENNESACACFGYDEKDTEQWAVKYMKIWHTIMTAIWITIGWITYAPISFIAKKIGVIFKRTWIAVLVAVILYFGITLAPLWIKLIENLSTKI